MVKIHELIPTSFVYLGYMLAMTTFIVGSTYVWFKGYLFILFPLLLVMSFVALLFFE